MKFIFTPSPPSWDNVPPYGLFFFGRHPLDNHHMWPLYFKGCNDFIWFKLSWWKTLKLAMIWTRVRLINKHEIWMSRNIGAKYFCEKQFFQHPWFKKKFGQIKRRLSEKFDKLYNPKYLLKLYTHVRPSDWLMNYFSNWLALADCPLQC